MGVYYRCKLCRGNHRSPIVFDKKSFESITLEPNQFRCPKTKKMAMYDKKDMFWSWNNKYKN
jgi:hypothetical protein